MLDAKHETLDRLSRWAATLAFDVDDHSEPLVSGFIRRFETEARVLGATEAEIDAAERVEVTS